MDKQCWHILGAGSIGCLWAANLSAKGEPVELILREESRHSLPKPPHKLVLTHGEHSAELPVSLTTPTNINRPISRLIVCTKAQDALSAIESVAHFLNQDSRILLLQNGMGSQQAIARAFPELVIWVGSMTDGAYLTRPFHVCHAGRGQTTIGPLTDGADEDDFKVMLSDFRLNVTVADADLIKAKLWNKLAINCCINGLTALFDCCNGELLDNGPHQQRLDELITETSQVLVDYGIQQTSLQQSVYQVCQKTAANVSSTCQDARRKRTTELVYINGFLIEEATLKGMPSKASCRLMAELRQRGIH